MSKPNPALMATLGLSFRYMFVCYFCRCGIAGLNAYFAAYQRQWLLVKFSELLCLAELL
ncbi:MAG: hypothetical protein M3O09_03615 [Acidobacteriota bacterium]|nr:hypothetical protein [Acidobacteriota bacterium]